LDFRGAPLPRKASKKSRPRPNIDLDDDADDEEYQPCPISIKKSCSEYVSWTPKENRAFFRIFDRAIEAAGGKAPGLKAVQELKQQVPELNGRSVSKIKSKFLNELKKRRNASSDSGCVTKRMKRV
jgi:hypothetical protein